MQYLVTLADEEQFTRAASVCGVSQSGLSAAIRALEDELGTSLFDRTTRGSNRHPAGLALLPHARTMLAQARRRATRWCGPPASCPAVCGSARSSASGSSTSCRCSIGCTAVTRWWIWTSPRRARTSWCSRSGTGASTSPSSRPRTLGAVSRVEFGRRPMILLAAPDHPLARVDSPAWDRPDRRGLRRLPGVLGDPLPERQHVPRHGVTRHVRCTVNDVHTLLDLVHRGLGAAIVPQHVGAKPQAAGLAALAMPGHRSRLGGVGDHRGALGHHVTGPRPARRRSGADRLRRGPRLGSSHRSRSSAEPVPG